MNTFLLTVVREVWDETVLNAICFL